MYYSILTLIKSKYFVLHNKVALLKRRRSERGTRNHNQIIFRKVLAIENVDQKMNFLWLETEIRLPFYTSFSTFWNKFGGLYAQFFYSWAWVRGDVNIKPEIFQIEGKDCSETLTETKSKYGKCHLVRLQVP